MVTPSVVLLTLDVRGCILRNGHVRLVPLQLQDFYHIPTSDCQKEQSTMLAVTSDLGEFRLVSNG
ncbi:Cystic fibrosis transmembrane conductance regulator [Frankliniella fusca]|uniref:Cystic fibrosis transmembrane conductance regulator n=1 Tax=Frankliniella fusca TaxID=407009 RepID=A0AAE1HWB5_9NEOP|nr:Cystic fibrosis transmembrane conductance regulator [Frankliniella fusca]KAK3928021.1 Cystic fibrosis transmembrane conductance regulator [Frankliniella fusca]